MLVYKEMPQRAHVFSQSSLFVFPQSSVLVFPLKAACSCFLSEQRACVYSESSVPVFPLTAGGASHATATAAEPDEWALTDREREHYGNYFEKADQDGDGVVGGA